VTENEVRFAAELLEQLLGISSLRNPFVDQCFKCFSKGGFHKYLQIETIAFRYQYMSKVAEVD
jgi:hypothetical protein